MRVWQFNRARYKERKKKSRTDSRRSARRFGLAVEPLEQRVLFAISPTLVSIISNIPNEGDIITSATPPLHVAPRELTFRFDQGQAIDPTTLPTGIKILRSGGDGVFGNGNDLVVATGFAGVPEESNEAVIRFLDTLPDDTYQITIVGAGAGALKNTAGQAFNNGSNSTTTFRLDLGAQVTAVVPQPITRNASGQLVQANNQIVVYFNNDKLNPASAQDTDLYQLIFTAGSATTADDVVFRPTTVVYNPNTNSAVLTFSGPLSSLAGPGTYRLRIGDNATSVATQTVNVVSDAGSSFGTATELGVLGTQSKALVGGAIDPPGSSPTNLPYNLNLPGGNDDPGTQNIPVESHVNGADTTPGITTLEYNFQSIYGQDPDGNTLFNQITEVQKQRVREVFEMYGYYLGVKFVETPDQGFTIATGDMRAIDPTVPAERGGLKGLAGTTSIGLTAVMDNSENWANSEFGGDFFQIAMNEIGNLLGLGNAYDLPAGTNQASDGETPPVEAEPVFPGDADILHGQHLFRPESKDIDLYRFTLNSAGRFSAETIAERLSDPTLTDGLSHDSSLADTVITLYDSTGKIVARNDDYFSSDSFVDLTLGAGTYFVAVTSTGNTNFDPNVVDSGFGGTTQGPYTLRLNFTPSTPGKQLVDQTGTALDGDSDGVPGGQYNFWFNVSNTTNTPGERTIYVDKVAATAGADGTLASPYNNIQVALAAAVAGDLVRIVGNGGADGNLATLGDNRAYEIGLDLFGGPLSDGATMDVPKGVTVMIDAGAVFKLRAANINAGSFSQGIDLSGGALQVLGTTQQKVTFTSYNNEAIGVDTNPLLQTPAPGDWGGLVFRDDSDREGAGIFLNYVAQADIGFGGGSVTVDSTQQVFDPIHMVIARPRVFYNSIHDSADAAISADPDSFEESLFRNNAFTADYRRVGPEVHGNVLARNSINGLFVRIRTEAGVPLDVMSVAGRFDDTDIVHVITENLVIAGTPGGPLLAGGVVQARLDARLAIDPNIVVKMQGSRIEVGVGAQLIAEGRAGSPVVFTSLLDDHYGAGGVFDTTGEGTSSGTPGDWGGLYFHPVSKGNIDHATITFAGGNTPIEGGFAIFNPVEIRQADVRIANSIIERSADGFDTANDRNGRGVNAAATIFIRGAQPIIVDNIIRDNRGDAISVNASALNAKLVGDTGRTTGAIQRFTQFDDNHGPLVAGNKLQENDVNGMAVRSIDNQAHINFRIGPGLAGNQAAVEAFQRAAREWEKLLKDPITITIDINFQPLANPFVVGQTLATQSEVDYNELRQLLIDDSQAGEDLVQKLPTFQQLIEGILEWPANRPPVLPPNYTVEDILPLIELNRANALALGMSPSDLPFVPSAYDPQTPVDGTIQFNSDLNFDFSQSDGITQGAVDFTAVAVHEIGHALGFVSFVDTIDLALPAVIPVTLNPLDLFRLPPGSGFDDFTFASRVLAPAFPYQVFYDGEFNRPDITFTQPVANLPRLTVGDVPLSRGVRFGDGNQASHWKDNGQIGQFIGAMTSEVGILDPNIGDTEPGAITSADIRAFGLLGYDLKTRSQSITTQTIWDDSDIVHVVRNNIDVPNFASEGGLRLQSSPTQSLVVKLDGPDAGFTAGGEPLDISDRIGGTVQVLGTPGHPVVVTSLFDNSVGAGFDLSGRPQNNTIAPKLDPVVGPTTNTSHLPASQTEATIAMDPTFTNRLFVASNTNQSGGALMASYSVDGGQTWTSRIMADGSDGLPRAIGDPSASWDQFGNLFLSYLGTGQTVVVLGSNDQGRSFTLVDDTIATGADQPTITTGPSDLANVGSVWVSFELGGNINVAGAYVVGLGARGGNPAVYDGVLTRLAPGVVAQGFGTPVAMPRQQNVTTPMNFGDIAIGPKGQVIVTYQTNDGGQGPSTIYTNTDPDGFGPAVFGPAITVTTTNVGPFDAIPAQPDRTIDSEAGLAWDHSGGVFDGRIYLVYTEETAAENNDTDIMLRYSDDNGATWSAAVRVNDDQTNRSQFLPRIAIDQTNGDVAITWYDARNDSGSGPGSTNATPNDDVQFWGTFSQDGGRSFAKNIQISAGTSSQKLAGGPAAGLADIDYGDYTGLAFNGGSFFAAWADNSPQLAGNPDGTTFDIATASVTVPIVPHSRDWRSIRLTEYSNDRNVDVVNELETSYTGTNDVNSVPSKAQPLGTLAPDVKNGDDNRRLGFEVHGFISLDRTADQDIYSFTGTAGTQVWIDIDKTSASLDTVVELINSNLTVVARSNNSADESTNPAVLAGLLPSNQALILQASSFSGQDLYTANPKDAGMRVVLPGTAGSTNTYYVRVRSAGQNLNNLTDGRTRGEYQLQIRLQEIDEVPGSTVKYADIRYAKTGIEVLGLPAHSYLTGEIGRASTFNSITGSVPFISPGLTAQDLGNLLANDRGTIALSTRQETFDEVQWYKFTVDYQSIQRIKDYTDGGKTWSTLFDVDYADGIARPDLTLALFDDASDDPHFIGLRLIAVARDSHVADDQPPPTNTSSAADLSRGSFGNGDPFLGSLQLEEGQTKTYYLALTSAAMLPTVLDQFVVDNAANKLVRLEPVDSVQRVVEDHIGSVGYDTNSTNPTQTTILPATGPILPIDDKIDPVTNANQLSTYVRPFTLADVSLYVSQAGGALQLVNPFTGAVQQTISGNTQRGLGDIVIRSDNLLYGTEGLDFVSEDQANASRLSVIDPQDGTRFVIGLDGIAEVSNPPPVPPQQPPQDAASAFQADAITFQRFDPGNPLIPATGAIFEPYEEFESVFDFSTGSSKLYVANAINGLASNTANGGFAVGLIYETAPGDLGVVTGLSFVQRQGRVLFAPGANTIIDGQTFSIAGASTIVTFEFDKVGSPPANPNNIAIPIVGTETAADVALLIQTAILAANARFALGVTPTLDPTDLTNTSLILEGAFAGSAGNSQVVITTLPNNGNTLYGVSTSGAFFSIDTNHFYVPGAPEPLATVIRPASAATPWAGLSAAPQNLDVDGDGRGGDLANKLFAITNTGDLYCIDPITGNFVTNINGVALFPNGADHVSTGLQGTSGLAFSRLDFNLWHPTNQQSSDPGHGINATADNSRPSAGGGTSFYFGLENVNANGRPDSYLTYTQNTQFGPRMENSQFGVLRAADQLDLTWSSTRAAAGLTTAFPTVFATNYGNFGDVDSPRARMFEGNNYNTPGGAHGSLVTGAFSLEGYANSDVPTLYFNYFRQTDVGTLPPDIVGGAGDGITVLGSADGGKTWVNLSVTTFNQVKGDSDPVDDNYWRQARVNLSQFAGEESVQIRFDFASNVRNNNYKGLYIDDIIVGSSGRGEIVTGPLTVAHDPVTGNIILDAFGQTIPDFLLSSAFFQTSPVPNPGNPSQVLVGSYTLEIRRGQEYASSTNALDPTTQIDEQFQPFDRLAQAFTLVSPAGTNLAVHAATSLTAPAGSSLTDGQTFTIADTAHVPVIFEFDSGGGVTAGRVAVPFALNSTAAEVAQAIATAVNQRGGQTFNVAAQVNSVTTDRVELAGAMTVDGTATPSLTVNKINDGDTFTVNDGVNPAVVFEFDSGGGVGAGRVPVPFALGDGVITIAQVIEAVLNAVDAAPLPFNAHASHNGPGDVVYFDGAKTLVTTGAAISVVPVVLDGQTFVVSDGVNQRTFEFDRNGSAGAGRIAIPIAFDSPEGLAKKIRDAINGQNGGAFHVASSSRNTNARVDLAGAASVITAATPALGVLQFGTTTLDAPAGANVLDGDTFAIFDGRHTLTFEFDRNGSVAAGNVAIAFKGTETPEAMAQLIYAAINGQTSPNFLVIAQTPVSLRVDLAGVNAFTNKTVALEVHNHTGNGDSNEPRQQGQIILQGNSVRYAADYGIVVDAGRRDEAGSHPGAVRNLRELNTARLVPGTVLADNILDSNGDGGILFSGDANNTDLSLGPVPFGRILNNTVYGVGLGIGINVNESSSPTLLNNIVTNFQTGILVSANSTSTVVGATLYQANKVNTVGTGLGSFAITQAANAPLFVNAATHNFNLLKTNGTGAINQAIDSSLDTLQDRQPMITVDQPLGIGPSPILAPATDLTGKLRVDDPSVNPPIPGLGANVFKDRGALDRSDFAGPTAGLANPVDNDAAGLDQNPALNSVVAGTSLTDFQVQLSDGIGAGVDDLTVSSARFTLSRDGVTLVEGIDYVFGYDATNKVARFTPLVGIWTTNHVYVITVDNSAATGIKDLAANPLQPNELSGLTRFTIALLPVDFGDAPDGPYATLFANNGARHVLSDALFLGSGVSAEPNGKPSSTAAGDDLDDGVVFNTSVVPGTTATVTVTASQAGKLDAWIDYNGNGLWTDAGEQIFASRSLVAGANVLTFQVPATTITSTFARFRVSTAGGLAPTGIAADGEVEDYQVDMPPVVNYSVVLVNPATGKELLRDASGNYVVLGGTTFRAQVFVDDARAVGAAGGVSSAFADLTRDSSFITWTGLAISPTFANSQSGTIDVGQQIVDEAGGVGNVSPTGADPKQLLFTVDGSVNAAAPLGTLMTVSLDPADGATHNTLVYGLAAPVSATYGTANLIVPVHAWNNPQNPMDVDADGFVVGLDALLVINNLNRQFGGPNGQLPEPPVPPTIPPPYLDVDADGFLTGLDALIIIRFLNVQAQAQAGGGASSASVPPQQAPLVVDAAQPSAAAATVTATAPPRVAMETGLPESASVMAAAFATPPAATVDAAPAPSGRSAPASTASLSSGTSVTETLFAHDEDVVQPLSARRFDETPWSTTSVAQASVASRTAAGVTSRKQGYAGVQAAHEAEGSLRTTAVARLFARHSEDSDLLDTDEVEPRLAGAWSKTEAKASNRRAR